MNQRSASLGASLFCLFHLFTLTPSATAHDDGKAGGLTPPTGPGGGAGDYASSNVTFQSRLAISEIGGTASSYGAAIWGWADPLTNREYAVYGLSNGTSFIDITIPTAPVYLGQLPSNTGETIWRELKVYNNNVYVVSDNNGNHGMQVFDLTQLRNVNTPQTFAPNYTYTGVTSAHNIAINEQSGFAYIVGSNQASGGLHMVDLKGTAEAPMIPVAAGNYGADGYTHDVQVVNYTGPDPTFAGREIAFASNGSFSADGDRFVIADVTDKANPVRLSTTGYPFAGYTHQGWLSDDHRYFLMDDEFDESENPGIGSRTHIWDLLNLTSPTYLGFYESPTLKSIDHNLYIKDGLVYESNYSSGLRVLDMSGVGKPGAVNGGLVEVAFFDTYPTDDAPSYNGAWGAYPFFPSGNVIIGDRNNGLFVVKVDVTSASVAAPEPGTFTFAALGLGILGICARRKRQRTLCPS